MGALPGTPGAKGRKVGRVVKVQRKSVRFLKVAAAVVALGFVTGCAPTGADTTGSLASAAGAVGTVGATGTRTRTSTKGTGAVDTSNPVPDASAKTANTIAWINDPLTRKLMGIPDQSLPPKDTIVPGSKEHFDNVFGQ